MREVSESEIVFQRQICKPLVQLVSGFHSEETIPTVVSAYFEVFAFFR